MRNNLYAALLMLLFSTIVLTGCWEHQNKDVTRPPVAVYTLSGYVYDHTGGEPLANVGIAIHNISSDKDYYEIRDTTYTDSTGYYEFTEKVSPGQCIVKVRREGYLVFNKLLNMVYSDRAYDVKLPRLLLAAQSDIEPPYGEVAGICFKSSSTMAMIDKWETEIEGSTVILPVIYELHIDSNRYRLRYDPGGKRYAYAYSGIASGGSSYWMGSAAGIYKIRENDLSLTGSLEHSCNDMTWDGSNLCFAKGQKISKVIDFDDGTVDEYIFNGHDMHGLAWDGAHYWATDTESTHLYRMDDSFAINGYFIVFMEGRTDNPLVAKYLAIQGRNRLWLLSESVFYHVRLP